MVRAKRLDHGGADHARHNGDLGQGEDDHREHDGPHRAVVPAADGKPGQHEAEHDLEDRRDHEVRDRQAHRAEAGHHVIGPAVLAEGRNRAERAADEDRDQKRKRAERHGDGEAAGEEIADREIAEVEGRPEIAPKERREVEPVLLDEGAVELVDPAEVFHDLRFERLLQVEGATRRHTDQKKGNRDDQQERRKGRQKAAQDEGDQAGRLINLEEGEAPRTVVRGADRFTA
jgi:hypothetical protein